MGHFQGDDVKSTNDKGSKQKMKFAQVKRVLSH